MSSPTGWRSKPDSPNRSPQLSQKSSSSSSPGRSSGAKRPRRQPLQERSDTENNSNAGGDSPTIRIVRDSTDQEQQEAEDREDIEKEEEEEAAEQEEEEVEDELDEVENLQSIYTRSPFPSHPSHVLAPGGLQRFRAPHGGIEARDVSAGRLQQSMLAHTRTSPPDTGRISSLSRYSSQPSESTRVSSDADTLVNPAYSTVSSRYSQASGSFRSISPAAIRSKDTKVSLTAVPPSLPKEFQSPKDTPTIRTVADTPRSATTAAAIAAAEEKFPRHAKSDRSLSSSGSSLRAGSDKSANWIAVPDPDSPPPPPRSPHRLARASVEAQKQAYSSPETPKRPINFSTPARSDARPGLARRTSTQQPLSSNPTTSPHGSILEQPGSPDQVQYPTIRAPSGSGLRAKYAPAASAASPSSSTSSPLRKQAHRQSYMVDPNAYQQWSTNLSTIPSESDAASPRVFPGSSPISPSGYVSSPSRLRRATIDSVSSAAMAIPSSQEGSPYWSSSSPTGILASSPDLLRQREDSGEWDDVVPEIQSPYLRHQHSFANRRASDPRPGSSASRQSSTGSSRVRNFRQTLPAWARLYYRKGERISFPPPASVTTEDDLSRFDSITSGTSGSPADDVHFVPAIYRPRNRPFPTNPGGFAQHRMEANERYNNDRELPAALVSADLQEPEPLRVNVPRGNVVTIEDNENTRIMSQIASGGQPSMIERVVPRPRPQLSMAGMYSPRLMRDRRSAARLSTWTVPSIDENFFQREAGVKHAVSARGNRQVVLFAIGFVFPPSWILASMLPLPNRTDFSKEVTGSQLQVELAIRSSIHPMEERRYLKARWWRNLNRVMAVVGIALISAVIAIVIVAKISGMW